MQKKYYDGFAVQRIIFDNTDGELMLKLLQAFAVEPSAEVVEPKKGKWETKPFIDPNDPMKDTGAVWCRCSECKNKLGVFQDGNFFDYCPHCGAKMERSEE